MITNSPMKYSTRSSPFYRWAALIYLAVVLVLQCFFLQRQFIGELFYGVFLFFSACLTIGTVVIGLAELAFYKRFRELSWVSVLALSIFAVNLIGAVVVNWFVKSDIQMLQREIKKFYNQNKRYPTSLNLALNEHSIPTPQSYPARVGYVSYFEHNGRHYLNYKTFPHQIHSYCFETEELGTSDSPS